MYNIILLTVAVFNIILSSVTGISCKDESGTNIPTWNIMKLPQGTDYYYYDVNNGYNFSPHSLNDTEEGALAQTMNQLWSSETQYIIYNDEPPKQITYNFSVAHSKAVWMWDTSSAIVITHSIPEFPSGPKEQDTYTGLMQNAWKYGQTATCFQVSLSSLSNIFGLIEQTVPLIYDMFCKNCYSQIYHYTNIPCSTYIIDDTYVLFMKPSSVNVDVWASCIAPYMSSNVSVETWIHGTMDGPYCPPEYPFQVLDIQALQFPKGQTFTEYYDHSKWGILQDSVVCFGDLNRVISQMERAGTVYCWKDSELWAQLNQLIVKTNSC